MTIVSFHGARCFTNVKFSRGGERAIVDFVPPRILILTASFGDGHNSAARGLAAAFGRVAPERYRVEVRDLVAEAEPWKGRKLQQLYAFAITHVPEVWRQFYKLAARMPLREDPLHVFGRIEQALVRELRADPPAAVVATFPLYPQQIQKMFGAAGPGMPVYTVVTDSITVHPVWMSDVAAAYFVADDCTSREMRRQGVEPARIVTTGFAVNPVFAEMNVQPPADSPESLLYFPVSSAGAVRTGLASMLRDGPPQLQLTVVLGRHHQRLGGVVKEVAAAFPERRVATLGWVDDVPALMASHDVVVAKAGGATTHECAAAGRPLVIAKIVPGQEEGNAELVERLRCGVREERPAELGRALARLASPAVWRKVRDAAWSQRRPAGALRIARHVVGALADG